MHRVNRKNITLLAGFSLLLGACSLPEGEFPSLAKRPYESADPVAEPPAEPASLSTRLPDSLRTQLEALVARHNAAEAAFRAALPATRQAAQSAAGSATGSETWVVAQMEISRLEEKRSESLAALAEIDRLVTGERDKGADAGLTALMEPYQQAVQREVDEQTGILVDLARLTG